MGIVNYGFMSFGRDEADIGPPPLLTNYLVALKTVSENGETNDSMISIFTVYESGQKTEFL